MQIAWKVEISKDEQNGKMLTFDFYLNGQIVMSRFD